MAGHNEFLLDLLEAVLEIRSVSYGGRKFGRDGSGFGGRGSELLPQGLVFYLYLEDLMGKLLVLVLMFADPGVRLGDIVEPLARVLV